MLVLVHLIANHILRSGRARTETGVRVLRDAYICDILAPLE